MPPSTWSLVPKLRPEKAEEQERLLREREDARRELRSIGLFAKFLVPSKGRREVELKSRIAKLSRQLDACFGEPGYDLEPPRIGIDEKATAWYRKHLSQDPDAWPLPPDEMVEEMRGQPVWELSQHRELQHLDVGWPKGGFPVPGGAALPLELSSRLAQHLTAEESVALAEPLRDAVVAYFRRTYPSLGEASFPEVVHAVVRGATPGGPPGSIAQRDAEFAHNALSAAQWLEFWGSHGYGFKCSAVASH